MAKRRFKRDHVAEAFGAALIRARSEAGITQDRLAVLAKLHRTTIGLYERGIKCPALDTFFRLADAMEADATEMFKQVAAELARRR